MNRPIWEGIYAHLDEVPANGPGFGGPVWIRRSLDRARENLARYSASGDAPAGGWARESPLPLAAAMVCAGRDRLHLLDFGGGIGNGYPAVAHSLPPTVALDYAVVETPAVCEAGAAFFQGDSRIRFLPDMNGAGPADLVHIGSALQYVGPWQALLERLCLLAGTAIVFTDLMAGAVPTFATVQHYYDSDIPFWFFNMEAITERLVGAGFRLVYDVRFESKIIGAYQPLPQNNFPPAYRLGYARNMVWIRKAVP